MTVTLAGWVFAFGTVILLVGSLAEPVGSLKSTVRLVLAIGCVAVSVALFWAC